MPSRLTSSASIPASLPTQSTSVSACLAFNACSAARAGYAPPPVPPAQISSRTLWPPFILWLLLAPLSRDVQHDPNGRQAGYQVGSARAHKRQRIAREWQ